MKMKWNLSVISFLLMVVVFAEKSDGDENGQLLLAKECDEDLCKLPDCQCSDTKIPGGLDPRHTPQFVLLTFDDAVNIINIETYRRILNDRRNSNQCQVGATYFINHEYTNYVLVNELYNRGHEIALHSITHRTDQQFWREATTEDMLREFGDQRVQMAHFANIPFDRISGLRMPFLQLTGNSTFAAMAESGLKYDCSWPTISNINPGLWPYTLDYASTQDCVIPPCPTASIPGVWVIPMISWQDLNGTPCSMVDSCFAAFTPDRTDEEAWFRFMLTNFERHYTGNRAPFGFYVHEWFIATNPAIERALMRFMDVVTNLPDAFMVTGNEVVEWVKNPVTVEEYRNQPCRFVQPTPCHAASCGPLHSTHNGLDYWMQICNACPRSYPWINNPLGN